MEVTPDYRPLSLSFDVPEAFVGTSLLKRDMVCVDTLKEELQLAVTALFSSMSKLAITDKPLNLAVKGLITSLLGIVEETIGYNNITITGKNCNTAKY